MWDKLFNSVLKGKHNIIEMVHVYWRNIECQTIVYMNCYLLLWSNIFKTTYMDNA